MSADFTAEQKRYLEGFAAGIAARESSRQESVTRSKPIGPDAAHLEAQDRTVAKGGKLVDQEKWKRERHPFDSYSILVAQAKENAAPKPADNFRWRYYGLFYVAPAQNSYMARLRIPNGILTHQQLSGLADLSERFGGGYLHITTRANIQIREIEPKSAVDIITEVQNLGLWSKGAGADNIRNITGTPTAGIDPQELIDTRPYSRAMHHHILEDRSLSGLPRKFNIAFDGAGLIGALEDTNDIGFQAVQIMGERDVNPGVYFKLMLGGITGHKDFARDTGVIVQPDDAVIVADSILRVFIDHGDRTDRSRARLKYLLDAWGLEKFLATVEEKLGKKLLRISKDSKIKRPSQDRLAHIGVHSQKQAGLNWIGVAIPVGRLTPNQTRGLANIAKVYGDGSLRLTVWQNIIIGGVTDSNLSVAMNDIRSLGLLHEASPVRAGIVACTGAFGCRFAAADTKQQAIQITEYCENFVQMDAAVNIHLTGCHHSCAQHYIGDIGLIAARIPKNDDGDTEEGYHILIGGGFGNDATIARELYFNVKANDVPRTVASILRAYLHHRFDSNESIVSFFRRNDIETVKKLSHKFLLLKEWS